MHSLRCLSQVRLSERSGISDPSKGEVDYDAIRGQPFFTVYTDSDWTNLVHSLTVAASNCIPGIDVLMCWQEVPTPQHHELPPPPSGATTALPTGAHPESGASVGGAVTVKDIQQQDVKTNTYKQFLKPDEKVLFTGAHSALSNTRRKPRAVDVPQGH